VQDDPRRRILVATYACVARWGLAKTTVEDAAREAGLSRATVYRYYPGGRDELLDAVVAWQMLEFFGRLQDEVAGADTLEAVLTRGLTFARRSLLDHQVLQTVLQTEPDVLLPKLTVQANRILGLITAFLVPFVARAPRRPGVDVDEAADFLARMSLSLLSAPGRWNLEDLDQVTDLVRRELLAGIVAGPLPTPG